MVDILYLFSSMLTPLMGLRGFCSGLVLQGQWPRQAKVMGTMLSCPRRNRWEGTFCNFFPGEVWFQPPMRWKLPKVVLKRQSQGECLAWRRQQNLRSRAGWVPGTESSRPQLWPGICPEEVEENMYMTHQQWRCWVLAEGKSRPGKGMWLEGQREHNCIKEHTLEWQKSRGDLLYIINYVPLAAYYLMMTTLLVTLRCLLPLLAFANILLQQGPFTCGRKPKHLTLQWYSPSPAQSCTPISPASSPCP